MVLGGWRTGGWNDLCAPLTWSSTNQKGPVSLSVAVVKIFEWVSGHVWESGGVIWERPTAILKITPRLFPFKVDQFKSDIKIRNNQVKKNTAKGYSIYIQ